MSVFFVALLLFQLVIGIINQETTTLKSGICIVGTRSNCSDLNDENIPMGGTAEIGWFYSWMLYSRFGETKHPYQSASTWWYNCSKYGGTPIKEFVPMVPSAQWSKIDKIDNDHKENHIDIVNTTYLLGYNEPNRYKQGNTTPDSGAKFWKKYILEYWGKNSKSPKILVGPSAHSCGDSDNTDSSNCITGYSDAYDWFNDFFANFSGSTLEDQIAASEIQYMAAHSYSCDVESVKKNLEQLYTTYKLPIWLTEFACGSGSNPKSKNEAEQINYINQIIPWLENSDIIFRYAWFEQRDDSKRSILEVNNWEKIGPVYTSVGNAYIQAIKNAHLPTMSPTSAPTTAPLIGPFVIDSNTMDYCSTSTRVDWSSVNDNINDDGIADIMFCYKSRHCLSANKHCTAIRRQSLIYKAFNVDGYALMTLKYDINIGPTDAFNNNDNAYDNIAVFYSCNKIFHLLTKYSGPNNEIHQNEQFILDQGICNDAHDLTIYFRADTNSIQERGLINNLSINGYTSENHYHQRINIFHDDMGLNYGLNWNVETGTVTVLSTVEKCIVPPCIQFEESTEIISNSISTVGYENIWLFWDINFGQDTFDANDEFDILFSCDGSIPSNIAKTYILNQYNEPVKPNYKFSESFNLPSSCNNIVNLKLLFQSNAMGSDLLYIRNVNIMGDPKYTISLNPTQTTINPTKNPTVNPTFMVTQSNMDNCAIDWNIINSNNVNTCYSSTNCLSINNVCVYISDLAVIYKTFSLNGYSSIILNYNIFVGPGNSLETDDFIEVYYSCNKYMGLAKRYDEQYVGVESISLPTICDDVNDLTIYFRSITSGEKALINGVSITAINNQQSNSNKINIFHDDMDGNYLTNWIPNWTGSISVVTESTHGANAVLKCIIPACLQFKRNRVLTSNSISILGYTQIQLSFDIIFRHFEEEEELFYVEYSCDNTDNFVIIKEYIAPDDDTYYISETFLLSSSCDYGTVLKLQFRSDQSSWDSTTEYVYLRNVNVFGNINPTAHSPMYFQYLSDLVVDPDDTQLSDIQKIIISAIAILVLVFMMITSCYCKSYFGPYQKVSVEDNV